MNYRKTVIQKQTIRTSPKINKSTFQLHIDVNLKVDKQAGTPLESEKSDIVLVRRLNDLPKNDKRH